MPSPLNTVNLDPVHDLDTLAQPTPTDVLCCTLIYDDVQQFLHTSRAFLAKFPLCQAVVLPNSIQSHQDFSCCVASYLRCGISSLANDIILMPVQATYHRAFSVATGFIAHFLTDSASQYRRQYTQWTMIGTTTRASIFMS